MTNYSHTSANFKYTNDNVEYISIKGMPYYDDGILKIKCLVYQFDSIKDKYVNEKLIFISNDNGINWELNN